ncbi:uncharacterized protein A4U43_C09F1850 [Asparagus officinalis]|uniref:Protein MAK16 homolog n=1 Tax=Asparagus officinalis TaxID=4686 RepID=A0A5P1E4T0_ASPOF|nr:uncharacterized protein A4U43_C09F1850 [Asparagus officinalis]
MRIITKLPPEYFAETLIMLRASAIGAPVLWPTAGMLRFEIMREFWPKLLVHKIKQRLTKMTQYRIRMRKLELKVREKIMTVPRKEKKREARREEKAEKAAILEKSIEKELLERLKKGVYGDIYNYPVLEYNKVLDMEGGEEKEVEEEDEEEPEIEYVEGYDELEEEQEEEDIEDFTGFMKDVSLKGNDFDDDEAEPSEKSTVRKRTKGSDLDKVDDDARATKLKRKGRVTIEFEHDEDLGDKQSACLRA